jgi:hypothetical protein
MQALSLTARHALEGSLALSLRHVCLAGSSFLNFTFTPHARRLHLLFTPRQRANNNTARRFRQLQRPPSIVRHAFVICETCTDKDQMDLGIAALFVEELVTVTNPEPATGPAALLNPHGDSARTAMYQDEVGGVSLSEEEFAGGPVIDSGLPFGMQVDTYAEDTIKSLLQESNLLKEKVARQKKAYEDLEQRVYKKAAVDVDLPTEVVRRLNRLENEVERFRIENKDLRDSLKVAESEVTALQDEIAGQKNKLKGAGKKVRNAKEVAGKQEEKAKSAVHDKQLRVLSERKMKQERNEATAEVARLTKQCDDLQTDLDVERAGEPHLRVNDPASDIAVAVIPVELSIDRAHFQKLSTVFKSNQISIAEQMQQWYANWKKPKEPSRQVVGANYVDKKQDKVAVDPEKLYADMVDLVDGHEQTGAEHDGPRSARSLQTICRKAEERHNGGN